MLEFVKFKERLAASHARAVAYAEMTVHRLTSLRSPTPATMLQAASAAPGTLGSVLPLGAHIPCILSCRLQGADCSYLILLKSLPFSPLRFI